MSLSAYEFGDEYRVLASRRLPPGTFALSSGDLVPTACAAECRPRITQSALLLHSLLVATTTMIATTLIPIPAAYALAHYDIPRKKDILF